MAPPCISRRTGQPGWTMMTAIHDALRRDLDQLIHTTASQRQAGPPRALRPPSPGSSLAPPLTSATRSSATCPPPPPRPPLDSMAAPPHPQHPAVARNADAAQRGHEVPGRQPYR